MGKCNAAVESSTHIPSDGSRFQRGACCKQVVVRDFLCHKTLERRKRLASSGLARGVFCVTDNSLHANLQLDLPLGGQYPKTLFVGTPNPQP